MEWYHDFCLFCDKQSIEGNAYCSQACRLADLERAGYSEPASPSSPRSSSWHPRHASNSSHFQLAPAVNFAAYKSSSGPQASSSRTLYIHQSTYPAANNASSSAVSSTPPKRLNSSSSRSSLSSISSTSSALSTLTLSNSVHTQLRDYSNSFDQVRDWKRRVTLV